MDEVMRYWPVVAFAFGLALTIAGWAIRKGLASQDELRAEAGTRARADAEIDERLSRLETEMDHIPNKESLHRVDLTLTELRGEIQVLTERLKPVAAISDRLQEFLIEQAKR
ncbi:conserved hypothetical protein [uncultured Pleomorphomonas sp.]|uniref:DUF2730 family protein n=1 Tax=uncultured Pleomorphomonas sp. TaxID=442121 RepID=A0A212LD63_9HYPH|nr:DUF2730 family protein [uncultured Pleomorphomonas sp.]SCM75427.1 conserved hypothetical protein [uncultured Pleomorphomonas sp.]